MEYIKRIRKNLTIPVSRKVTSLLNGLHRSVYRGKSLDFDNLREYVIGDDTRDIDWKSSIRHGELLIRQYVADRRHNILFIIDSGNKMEGLSRGEEEKADLAVMATGTLAYIANKNEDSVGFLYFDNKKPRFDGFKTGIKNIELLLHELHQKITKETEKNNLELLLNFANTKIQRKMLIVLVTDLAGVSELSEDVLKKTIINHDLLVINISDALAYGKETFDLESKSYLPKIFTKKKQLADLEIKTLSDLLMATTSKLAKNRASLVTIDKETEIVGKIIELLERHKHATRF